MPDHQSKIDKALSDLRSETVRSKWAAWFVKNKIPVTQYAHILTSDKKTGMFFAMMIGNILEHNPGHLRPDVGKLFALRHKVKFPNYSRTLAKLFWRCGLPPSRESEALDALFNWLTHPDEQVSIKIYSMYALAQACKKYPELKNEILIAIESQSEIDKPSWRHGVKTVMKEFQKK